MIRKGEYVDTQNDVYQEVVQMYANMKHLNVSDQDMQYKAVEESMEQLEHAVETNVDVDEACAQLVFSVFLLSELRRDDIRAAFLKVAALNLNPEGGDDDSGSNR